MASYSTGPLHMAGLSQVPARDKREVRSMDMWDFLKWRRTLRYTQAEAAVKLGVNRATIQNWERGVTRISKAAELACNELTRFWKQRPDFGPVALVYAEDPIWSQSEATSVLRGERFPTNDAAMERALALRQSPQFVSPHIIDRSGSVVWTNIELLHECDRRATEQTGRQTAQRSEYTQDTSPPKGSGRASPDDASGDKPRDPGQSKSDAGEGGSDSSDI